MKKRKLGKNRGIWCGTVVSDLELNHELKKMEDGQEKVIERFYTMTVSVELKDRKGDLKDSSNLPVIISESNLKELDEKPEMGKIVFLKGSWRTYDKTEGISHGTRLEQNVFVKVIEVHDEPPVKTRNKFEFEGVLVKKLYEIDRDEEGKPLRDENGKLKAKLDENDNMKYTTRKNKEGFRVNDFIVAINRPNGSDYVPSISYGRLATYIAKDIPIGAEVEGSGYIRSRYYESRGQERVAYEAVITYLKLIDDEDENIDEEKEIKENN